MIKDVREIQDNIRMNDISEVPIASELQEAFMQLHNITDLDEFMFELNKIIKNKVLHKE